MIVQRRRSNIALGVLCLATSSVAFAFFSSPAIAAPLHFSVDSDATEITATVPEPLASIRGDAVGKLRIISCDIFQDPKRPAADGANIWVEAFIDATSYHSNSSARDTLVKNSVLETQNFPTISFKGGSSWSDVKQTSDTSGSAVLKGQLTVHGATRPFEVPVQVSLSGDKLTATGEVAFDYTDFGIQQPSLLGLKAGNMVKVTFHTIATKAADAP